MELVEGRTLRSVIGGHALAIPEALRIATGIAAGLAQAHQANIVHRDLKPENVIITVDGHPKILDFGLAKLVEQQQEVLRSQLSQQETRPEEMTRAGKLLGTPAYMSPEQARGEDVDARSDIFAFGVTLYEMVTGLVPFRGRNLVETLAAILGQPPMPARRSNTEVPTRLEDILDKCLEKDPRDRYQSCRDLVVDLRRMGRDLASGSLPSHGVRAAEDGSLAALPAAVAARPKTRRWLGWATAVLLLVSTAILGVIRFRETPPETRPARFFILPPEKMTFSPFPVFLTVSPDGTRLAFMTVDSSGKRQLWVRGLDSLSAQPLPGTEGALGAGFWSPDSRFIVFVKDGKLQKIDVAGGRVQTLCEVPGGASAGTWNREGVILFTPGVDSPVHRVSAAGGTPTAVTALDASRQETWHLWTHFLPDGNHFLYLARSLIAENNAIWVGSLDGKAPKRLLSVNSSVQYAPPGYLLFVRDRTLLAQPFDADALELTGDAFPVAEPVQHLLYGNGRAAFAVSQTGVLAFRSDSGLNTQLTWFDRAGKPLGPFGQPGPFSDPELSRDGRRLAVEVEEAEGVGLDIWLMDLLRGTSARFTFDPANDGLPLWSPDGSWLAFSSDRVGDIDDIYQRRSSGAEKEQLLLQSETPKVPWDWSSDGRFLLYSDFDAARARFDLSALPLFGDRKPVPFLQTPFNEAHARFSPDARWVAYVSDESGRYEVYVESFPQATGKRQVSTNGGTQPRWRRDGRELFFLAADGKLMAVPIRGDAALEIGAPAALFEARLGGGVFSYRQEYDVTANGERFLLNLALPDARPITVVLNWTAGLEKQP